jgi:hypothetical protein
MEREDLLALAQQGHPKAIAALLNQQLKYRGMRCRVSFVDHVLHVVLSTTDETAKQAPDRGIALEFLRAKIINLDIENLTRVRLYGLAPDAENDTITTTTITTTTRTSTSTTSVIPEDPAWTQEFALVVGEYSSLVSAAIAPNEDQLIAASTPAVKPRSNRPNRSHRQPNLVSLAIVAIALSLIIFAGYKLIARNSRSTPKTPDPTAPSTLIPTEP